MSFLSRYLAGFGLLPTGFSLIFKSGVKRFVVIPLLINISLFSIAIWYGYSTILEQLKKLTDWLPAWLDWLTAIVWPLVVIAALIIIYYSFTLLANLISAPFNSLLSASIERHLRSDTAWQSTSMDNLPKIAARTIWSEIRKLLYQLKWLILLVPLTFIPGVNVVAPFAWFYFAAWMLAINYIDYPMGNQDLYFADVKRHLKTDRATALGVGSGILLLTMIPIVNFLAMPVGVATGTAYYVGARNEQALTR